MKMSKNDFQYILLSCALRLSQMIPTMFNPEKALIYNLISKCMFLKTSAILQLYISLGLNFIFCHNNTVLTLWLGLGTETTWLGSGNNMICHHRHS